MLMNDFSQTRLFDLLTESSQAVTNQEMQQAYESFVTEMESLNQTETDYSNIYRTLNITRIEFVSLQSLFQYEQGKKMCLRICTNRKR